MNKTQGEAVRYWWAQAEASLESAQREFIAGAYSFSVNRLYYALFYAASAALLDRQLSFTKHTGVRSAFHREFIKSGLLEIEWGKFYDKLFEDRQEGDYLVFVTFERDYVEDLVKMSKQFLETLRFRRI